MFDIGLDNVDLKMAEGQCWAAKRKSMKKKSRFFFHGQQVPSIFCFPFLFSLSLSLSLSLLLSLYRFSFLLEMFILEYDSLWVRQTDSRTGSKGREIALSIGNLEIRTMLGSLRPAFGWFHLSGCDAPLSNSEHQSRFDFNEILSLGNEL